MKWKQVIFVIIVDFYVIWQSVVYFTVSLSYDGLFCVCLWGFV